MNITARSLISVRAKGHSTREEDALLREQKLGTASVGRHTSVMVEEVLEYLAPKAGEVVVDATYGQGGHARALQKTADIRLIALDADPRAGEGEADVIEANFGDLEAVLKKLGVQKIDKALFDLGWSSPQLASGRGFSFLRDEPLSMSYGTKPASGFHAAEILNTWEEPALADVLYGYGEEKYARRIAQAVVARRDIHPIATTIELVEIIRDAVPAAYRHGRLHFATRSFQALRMAVNDELGVIERGVLAAWKRLSLGGRIAVISFHSVEDRAVKRLFVTLTKQGGKLLFKKPKVPSRKEVESNPRARSAKLRVIEKIAKKHD